MARTYRRREFLNYIGAGTAIVAVPGVTGCGKEAVITPKPPAAPTPRVSPTYYDQFGLDTALLKRVLERALSRGGDFAEIYLQHSIENWVGMEDGEINRAYADVNLGAGIRVLKGDATGYAYCEDLTEAALLQTASTAAAVADSKPQAVAQPLAAVAVASRYKIAVPWSDVGIDKRLPIIERANRTCRARDSRIVKVTVFLSDQTSHVLVANSEGLLVEDDQPMGVLMINCVAEHKGATENNGHSIAGRRDVSFFSPAAIDDCAQKAADRTTALFEAHPPPIGEIPVVLAPGISGIFLHEAIGHGMEADFNRKGVSIYANRIGQRIAPQHVTIVDGGAGQMRGSINIDDEGMATEETVLVENGILRSYLHDRISSRHYKVRSTGSGRRESFRFPPVPRMRNTYLRPGPHKPEEVIGSIKKGLYAEDFWNGQVFIGAGDFTFYLKSGRLIEDGKLTHVVKDANLIGSGPKVLENVSMVADDLQFESGAGYCGKDGQRVPVGFGLPTIRVGAISVGGRKA